MLRILSAVFTFFKTLCVKNPTKLILLIVGSVLLSITYNNREKNVPEVNKLVLYQVDGSNYFKVHTSNNGATYTLSHDSIKPESYTLYDYNGIFYATIIIGGISMGLFIIGLGMSIFSEDRDASWEFGECFSKSMNSFVVCDLEDGKFHYSIFGRLIAITERQVTNSVSYQYGLDSIEKILKLPKYKTRTKNRDEKLDKLGVK